MEQRPNFLVIHTDQQRYDCVGISRRREGIYTPWIDSIGYQGATFTGAYCNCPLCIPQRLSLLTGQTPQRHGLFSNTGIPYLPLEHTLPEQMRRGGYQTALVGRTMHTYPAELSYGFEYYLPGDPSSEKKDTTDPFFRYLREHSSAEDGGYYGGGSSNNSRAAYPFHLSDDCHQTKWATNRALDFLDNRDPSRPYLLFVGYYAPHSPHNPPAEFYNAYYQRTDLDEPYLSEWDIPPVSSGNTMARYQSLSKEELRRLYAGYYGNIAFIDSQVSRLLSRAQADRNTYVIFTSDHGEMLGDHYLMQKNRPYEGAVHIPFLMMGPGIADSQVIEEPVCWPDIMPTLLDLAGLPIPETVDGHSLVPLLQGEHPADWRVTIHGECCHDFLFDAKARPRSDAANYVFEKGSHYITDGKYKYIWYVTSGAEQLFDIVNDYKEQRNLAAETPSSPIRPEHAAILERFRKILIAELADRPEGMSDGTRLIAGKEPRKIDAAMSPLAKQRQEEGFTLAFGRKASPLDQLDYTNTLMK